MRWGLGREEQKQQAGRVSSGYAHALDAVEPPFTIDYIRLSLFGALLAGFVLLAYLVALSSTHDVLHPFRLLASLLLAEDALVASAPVGSIVLVGMLDNVLVSLFWGLVFGLLLASSRYQWSAGGIVTLGMLFGAAVWLVDFYALSPLFWPWLEAQSSVTQFLGHVFFFGFPLGGWVAWKAGV